MINFSFKECLWFLNRNFDDCLHTIGPDYVRKVILINNEPVLFEIREGLKIKEGNDLINDKPLLSEIHEGLTVKILQGKHSPDEFIRQWFDLDTDIQPFYDQLATHKDLAYMSRDFAGLRLMGIPDLFEAICWCIIGQQINLTFAYKIKRRLVETYGRQVLYEGQTYYTFPAPEVLADADPVLLKNMQLSGKKIEYLMGIAQVFKEGKMSKDILLSLKDVSEQQQALTAIRGIGIWTANYTLMKTLRVRSAIPYGDAGLLNGLIAHKIITDKKDLVSIDRFFQHFKGWESYGVFYLWRSLAPLITTTPVPDMPPQ